MSAEEHLDIAWISRMARAEKQAPAYYRPILNVHKWYARRSGAMVRALLVAEFVGDLEQHFAASHSFPHVNVLDPFMGGGTSLVETIRLGANGIGCDVNPMSAWTIREAVEGIDRLALQAQADALLASSEALLGDLYTTECRACGDSVPVTYFFWNKQARCDACNEVSTLVHQPLLASCRRHPTAVLICPSCIDVVPSETTPAVNASVNCPSCGGEIKEEGPTLQAPCQHCGTAGQMRSVLRSGRPAHRLVAVEYRCPCTPGRQFSRAGRADHQRVRIARRMLARLDGLPAPDAVIEQGDETRRAHRWNYWGVIDLFSTRQRLVLGVLGRGIRSIAEPRVRSALATVLSDMVRYNCELCRYDSWALKCRDAFAIHSFLVPLSYCEVNALGSAAVGTGGFRQVLRRYMRAKEYGERPYDMYPAGAEKSPTRRYASDENVIAEVMNSPEDTFGQGRKIWLGVHSGEHLMLPPGSVQAVITDPPYFDFVQYGDLLAIHGAWIRAVLPEADLDATALEHELTVKPGALGRGPERFAGGLSATFRNAASALVEGGLFAFTYHHSRREAYVPLVVALLDAELACTLVLPYVAEMVGSLHIRGRKASSVDSLFICRKMPAAIPSVMQSIEEDLEAIRRSGHDPTPSDCACVRFGRGVAAAVESLRPLWDANAPVAHRLRAAGAALGAVLAGEASAPIAAMPGGEP